MVLLNVQFRQLDAGHVVIRWLIMHAADGPGPSSSNWLVRESFKQAIDEKIRGFSHQPRRNGQLLQNFSSRPSELATLEESQFSEPGSISSSESINQGFTSPSQPDPLSSSAPLATEPVALVELSLRKEIITTAGISRRQLRFGLRPTLSASESTLAGRGGRVDDVNKLVFAGLSRQL